MFGISGSQPWTDALCQMCQHVADLLTQSLGPDDPEDIPVVPSTVFHIESSPAPRIDQENSAAPVLIDSSPLLIEPVRLVRGPVPNLGSSTITVASIGDFEDLWQRVRQKKKISRPATIRVHERSGIFYLLLVGLCLTTQMSGWTGSSFQVSHPLSS